MTRTTSLPVKPTQTPNQERRNIAKSPPRSSPATRIWTTTSWGLPPERHRNTTTPAKTSKTTAPSTSTAKNTDQKTKTNQASRNPKQAETAVEPPTKKKKNRKARGGLEDLVQEQDKLYAELNKKARNSK